MSRIYHTWAYPAMILLAVVSAALAGLHCHFRQNATPKDEIFSAVSDIAVSDPNAPEPEAGVPTFTQ